MGMTRYELELLFPHSKISFQMDLSPSVSSMDIDLEVIAPNVIPVGRYARVTRSSLAHDAGTIVDEVIKNAKSR